MCGIVGVSGRIGHDAAARALQCIAHRGPDDSGEFTDPDAEIWLGHRRLSILDLSPLGHQPMWSADRSLVTVFNGEIYNYRELRADLESQGHRFRSHSDTEVLLELYQARGVEALNRLNGIFAFAIWDTRDRSLLLVRDQLGIKPLYYAESHGRVGFCSEMKGLLALVPEMRELDPVALQGYLSFQWSPGESTPLKGVRKLGPGEAAIVRDGHVVRKWSWYQLPLLRGVKPSLSETQSIEGTRDGLRQAVHRQLISDVPVGAFLSGGLDSSAVVAFARERIPDIRCFTIESRGGQELGIPDDLPYAKRVAAHLGVPLDVVSIDSRSMAADLERMVAQLDEPLGDPAPLNVLYISRLARRHGIKVLLSGAGGDDLFSGYRRHVAVQFERWWQLIPRPLRLALQRGGATLDQRRSLSRRAAKFLDGAGLSGNERIVNYFRWIGEAPLRALYSKPFADAVAGASAARTMVDFLDRVPDDAGALDRMLALEQRFFLTDHNLAYTDRMSMAEGVEVRVPFLDVELVEHAARVPSAFKQRGRVGKWVLKKAMADQLPADVIYRPKAGFGAPVRQWMRHELRPLVGDLLSEASVRSRGLFDPSAIQRFIEQNDRGELDAGYTLLSLLSIEIWCRSYIDRRPAGESAA